MEPNKQLTMEETILDGQLAIEKLPEQSAIIVGNSRVGKSTLFTHLLNIPMKGSVDKNYEVTLNACFEEGAQTKDTYESVTLVPNVAEVNVNQVRMGLCDTAGFQDEGRSYVGVFGVSFLLDELLQKVKKPKFLLVIPHLKFQEPQVSQFLKPFEAFLRLFNIDTLINNEEIQNRIIKSIALVVLKSQFQLKRYLGGMMKAIDHLSALGENIPNQRKICLQILRSIHKDNRIQLFPQAREGQYLQRSTILQNLSRPETNWKAYDADGFDHNLVFRLPIQDDFKILSAKRPNQVELYREFSAHKKAFLTQSYKILSRLVEIGIKNWHQKAAVDYSSQFNEIKKLTKNNPYKKYDMIKLLKIQRLIKNKQNSQKGQKNPKNQATRIVSRLSFLKSLTQLEKRTIEFDIANRQESQLQKFTKVVGPCFETFDICRKTFCQNYDQQDLFITFMFMNHRSLIQNKIQIKIHPEENAGAIFLIMNTLTKILPQPMSGLQAKFISGFIPLGEEKKQFQEIIKHTMTDMNNNPEQKNFVLKSSLKLTMSSANLSLKSEEFFQGLEKFIEANDQFCKYLQTLPDQDNRDDKTNEFIEFKQLEIYKKIGLCLEGLNFNGYALEIYDDMKAVSMSVQCYKKMIERSSSKLKKLQVMKDYAAFLLSKGKKQILIPVYEEMIDEFIYFPQERKEIKRKLANALQSDFSNQLSDYVSQIERESMANCQQIIKKVKGEIDLIRQSSQENKDQIKIEEETNQEDLDELFVKRNCEEEQMEND